MTSRSGSSTAVLAAVVTVALGIGLALAWSYSSDGVADGAADGSAGGSEPSPAGSAPRVVVVGAGLSGLTAALELADGGAAVVVSIMLAEALGRVIIKFRELVEIHGLLIRQELFSDLNGQSVLGHQFSALSGSSFPSIPTPASAFNPAGPNHAPRRRAVGRRDDGYLDMSSDEMSQTFTVLS